MAKLLASGTDVGSLRTAVANTPGDRPTTIEIDVRDKVPFFPDTNTWLPSLLPGMDAAINRIPGHHVLSPSTYHVNSDGTGTLTINVGTNPLPFLGVTLVAVVVSIIGVASMIAWRIFQASPGEFSLILIALVIAGVGSLILFRRFG